jgi:recombinational DNA repair ATPase RecF
VRLLLLRLSGFKGIDVSLPWASAVVLFRANDSGKTNIVEGIEYLLTGYVHGRADPYREEPDPPEPHLVVDLPGLEIGPA